MAAVRSGDRVELREELGRTHAEEGRDDALRPTREPQRPTREPLRPTRDAVGLAPFVPAPPLPPIAPAPRVSVARRSRAASSGRIESGTRALSPLALRPDEAVHASRGVPSAYVVARYRRDVLTPAVVALRTRGFEITAMREAAPGPVGLGTELARTLRRATIGATALGAIGALIGATLVRGDALVPSWGWLPGPVVGAAFGAGVLGVVGFVIAAITLLCAPSSMASALAVGDRDLLVVRGTSGPTELVAAIVESGGEILAHGPR